MNTGTRLENSRSRCASFIPLHSHPQEPTTSSHNGIGVIAAGNTEKQQAVVKRTTATEKPRMPQIMTGNETANKTAGRVKAPDARISGRMGDSFPHASKSRIPERVHSEKTTVTKVFQPKLNTTVQMKIKDKDPAASKSRIPERVHSEKIAVTKVFQPKLNTTVQMKIKDKNPAASKSRIPQHVPFRKTELTKVFQPKLNTTERSTRTTANAQGTAKPSKISIQNEIRKHASSISEEFANFIVKIYDKGTPEIKRCILKANKQNYDYVIDNGNEGTFTSFIKANIKNQFHTNIKQLLENPKSKATEFRKIPLLDMFQHVKSGSR